MEQNKLKPCPFCGGEAKWFSCDRLITISCEACGYSRPFKSYLQTTPSKTRASAEGSALVEYYHAHADEVAIEAWNRRVNDAE